MWTCFPKYTNMINEIFNISYKCWQSNSWNVPYGIWPWYVLRELVQSYPENSAVKTDMDLFPKYTHMIDEIFNISYKCWQRMECTIWHWYVLGELVQCYPENSAVKTDHSPASPNTRLPISLGLGVFNNSYLSFFLHGQNFLRIKFTPKKTRKLRQNTQKIAQIIKTRCCTGFLGQFTV